MASLIEVMRVVSVVTEVAVHEAPSTSVFPQSHAQQRSAFDERIIETAPGFHGDARWVCWHGYPETHVWLCLRDASRVCGNTLLVIQ